MATQAVLTNYWVQIQAPQSVAAIIPTQIGVKGRTNGAVNNNIATWKFDASNDGVNYTTLLSSTSAITST